MQTGTPKVSVLMSVYNGEEYLREAVESIINQTFTNFEFLIINDGSTDKTEEILESYSDPRIRLVHQQNIGLTKSLNKGIKLAAGNYIARMDADDISLHHRLEKQTAFMEANPEVGICGSWVKTIGDKKGDIFRYEQNPKRIQAQLLFDSCLAHPSVIIRKNAIESYGLYYNPEYLYSQDWELWQRASFYFDLVNIPEILMYYRIHLTSITHSKKKETYQSLQKIDRINLNNLGIFPSDEEVAFHREIGSWRFENNLVFVKASRDWLIKLLKANQKTKIYHEKAFKQILAIRFLSICSKASTGKLLKYTFFLFSPFLMEIPYLLLNKYLNLFRE